MLHANEYNSSLHPTTSPSFAEYEWYEWYDTPSRFQSHKALPKKIYFLLLLQPFFFSSFSFFTVFGIIQPRRLLWILAFWFCLAKHDKKNWDKSKTLKHSNEVYRSRKTFSSRYWVLSVKWYKVLHIYVYTIWMCNACNGFESLVAINTFSKSWTCSTEKQTHRRTERTRKKGVSTLEAEEGPKRREKEQQHYRKVLIKIYSNCLYLPYSVAPKA